MAEPGSFRFGEGGLLNRFFAKTRWADPSIPGMTARVVAALVVAWLPLLIATAAQGLAWGDAVQAPFLKDPAAQVRFLIAMPLLLIAEPVLAQALDAVTRYLTGSGIVAESDRPKLKAVIADSDRWLGSLIPELLIAGLVIGLALSHDGPGRYEEFGPGVSNWGIGSGAGDRNFAGSWYYFVGLPIYRFLMLRWIWRYLVWALTLLRISRLRLTLTPSHPDMAGGLGFLGVGQVRFGILAFAFSAQLSGLFARKVIYEGEVMTALFHLILGYVAFATLFLLAPLLVFLPKLAAAKRRGLLEFGVLGEKYTGSFERKWIQQGERAGDAMLGSADFQSLADLAGGFDIVRRMRLWPFDWRAFVSLLISAALPFAPLLFFVFRFDELLLKTFRLIF